MKQAVGGVFVPWIIFKGDVNALCASRVSETIPLRPVKLNFSSHGLKLAH